MPRHHLHFQPLPVTSTYNVAGVAARVLQRGHTHTTATDALCWPLDLLPTPIATFTSVRATAPFQGKHSCTPGFQLRSPTPPIFLCNACALLCGFAGAVHLQGVGMGAKVAQLAAALGCTWLRPACALSALLVGHKNCLTFKGSVAQQLELIKMGKDEGLSPEIPYLRKNGKHMQQQPPGASTGITTPSWRRADLPCQRDQYPPWKSMQAGGQPYFRLAASQPICLKQWLLKNQIALYF